MSTIFAATVTIGRNVSTPKTIPERPRYYPETTVNVAVPMSPIRWAAFRARVRRVLLTAGLNVTAQNLGTGEWAGGVEENCVFVALFDATAKAEAVRADLSADVRAERTVADDELVLLTLTRGDIKAELEELKRQYKQDAIAFAWGPSELV